MANLSPNEACKTFNMGVGLCIICAPEDADAVRSELEASVKSLLLLARVLRVQVRFVTQIRCKNCW